MKYTFQITDRVDFLCSKCFHRNELTFNTEVSGDPEDAIPPRICIPYSHSANIRCGRCGGKMFAVDKSIGRMIQQLNLMGYQTKSCCGGHIVTRPINPQVVGSKMKSSEKMVKHASNEHDFVEEYRHASTSIDINDIIGVPEHEDFIDHPFLWFSHQMPDIKKKFIKFAIENIIKEYNYFQVKLYPCSKHGTLIEKKEVKIGESEYSSVIIEVNKDYLKQNEDIPNLTKAFPHFLSDLIIELDKISKIDHKEELV